MADEMFQGWVEDPVAVGEVLEGLPFPVFGSTDAAGLSLEECPDEVLGWKVWKEVTGNPWPVFQQGSIGSCVAFGTSAAIMFTIASECYAGEPETAFIPCFESIYGLSRVEIGQRRLGRGDGSIGAWAAKAVRDYGVLPQGVHGKYDLSSYSVSRCKDWGWSGLPDDLEPAAKKHPIKETTQVRTFDELVLALAQGFGVQVASSQGFSMRRDSAGYCTPSGRWQHSMSFIGYRRKGRAGAFIVNSWGGSTTTGPKSHEDAPLSGWWVEANVVESMLRQNDSFCFSGLAGMPRRTVDWSLI